MRLKAVVSIVVSLMFTLAVPNLGISQSENGQSHAAVLIPASTIERPEDVGLRAHTNHLIRFEGKPGGGGSLRRNSGIAALGVQAAVHRWQWRDCDRGRVRLPHGRE
jgi:hypothetical protein